MSETNRIEYKRELNKDVDIEKEVIAFLNDHEDGTIHIGMDKSGKEIGVADADDYAHKIKDRLKNNVSSDVVTSQVTPQVERLVLVLTGVHERQELQDLLGLSDRKNFRLNYLNPAIEAGLVVLLDPNSPTATSSGIY